MRATPYERNLLADALATLNPDFAALVEKLCPRPPAGSELRGIFDCMARRNERKQQAKLDADMGL